MDTDRFTSQKTGELLPIEFPYKDWAFVPNPLPSTYEPSDEVREILLHAYGALRELNGYAMGLKNPTLLLSPLQKREAIRSSSLEGTHAEPMDLLLFEREPKAPRSADDKSNDLLEVLNYDRALKHGWVAMSELPLSGRLLKDMHEILLTGVRGLDKEPGRFRSIQVHIGSDRRYIPPPPDQISNCIAELESYMNQDNSSLNPLIAAFMAHYQLEAIHPFRDGNGRIGRVLLSLTIALWCQLDLPWLYLSAYFEKYKDEYIDNMFRISTHGDWDRWIQFCLRGTWEQSNDAIRRCRELDALKHEFQEKAGSCTRCYRIVEEVFQVPVFEASDVMGWCNVSRPTAHADIKKLVGLGVLQQMPDKTPHRFFAPRLLEVVFSEAPQSEAGE